MKSIEEELERERERERDWMVVEEIKLDKS
jgi:hypothetical protein